ncbi:MAG: Asp-tRNA(Asn)/Glu-tRNA(Gln) amidotransferase subunit GatA [Phycisphaerae bacterium]|nr:Asp-tRNA(Asn)/Glu-tRNA(Gln) amidotransferase subunit GatA [Phycisphaerae bacterium]
MSGLIELSATQLAADIRSGETTSVQATQEYLNAITKLDGKLGAYNEIYTDAALDRAKQIDAKIAAGENPGPLAGVPIAIKDNLCTTYGHTTCASRYLENFQAPYTATAVKKLHDAGAVILGKCNMDEFAMGSSTENSGFAPTRNPWDIGRVPGGSSGGSAAAVASRMCAAALGSDTGGSIRQPASFCGCVGFKPTYGRVSRYGLVAFGSSLDQIGPLGRTVTDAALLTGVISGYDPHDATSLPNDVPDYLADIETPIKGLRIGLPKEFFLENEGAIAPDTRAAITAAIETYKSLGAEIVDVSLPHSRIDIDADGKMSSFAVSCYYIVCTAECSSNLARFDGVHYGHRTGENVDGILELYSKSRKESLGEEVKRRIMLGTYALSSGYYDAYYNKALKVRRLIADDFVEAFKSCDILLAPTTPTTAFKLGEKTDNPLEMYLSDIYTISANLAGLPGITLPAGLSSDNLPIGLQLIGPVLSESTLLRAARMFEKTAPPIIPPMVKNSDT